MKKIYGFVVLFLLLCFAVACSNQSVSTTQTRPPAISTTQFFPSTVIPLATETYILDPSPTDDIPSPTPSLTSTPTMDYPALVSQYLTPFTPYPFPTRNPNQPTAKPTATDIDWLKPVVEKKLPANWTPTPPPLAQRASISNYDEFNERNFPVFAPNWVTDHIQAATDLMNFTHADEKSFVKYVDAWTSDIYSLHWERTWFLKNDLDHDGQFEWLVSIPAYNESPQIFCCQQIMILFEKQGDVYQPVYFKVERSGSYHVIWQILQISDLNQNGYLDVVTSTKSCGSACGSHINIGEWDGQKWRQYSIQPVTNADLQILFMDVDGNRTIEMIVQYVTAYKLDQGYPRRNAVNIYSWKNGQYSLTEAWLQPNKTPYAVLRDVYSALQANDTDEALRLAQPALDNFAQTCSTMDTYTAIEVMLAHAMRNEPKEMEATLSFIMASCNAPKTPQPNQLKNGFIPAANILWLAYQKTYSPLLACKAMERFIADQRFRDGHTDKPEFSFQAGTLIYNFAACPLK
jgi:hypothetical protein